jgi:hypothetical protein
MKKEKQSNYIKPPKGFQLPEGVKPGDEFDLVVTFRVGQDGSLSPTKLGETPMDEEGKEGEVKTDKAPDYKEMSQGMAKEIDAASGGAGAQPGAQPAPQAMGM